MPLKESRFRHSCPTGTSGRDSPAGSIHPQPHGTNSGVTEPNWMFQSQFRCYGTNFGVTELIQEQACVCLFVMAAPQEGAGPCCLLWGGLRLWLSRRGAIPHTDLSWLQSQPGTFLRGWALVWGGADRARLR